MAFKNFTELEVYQESRKLRIAISGLVKSNFPDNEKYKLIDQIIRSSRSVTANIAEGFGRYYYKENIRFCRISRGSLNETLEHVITVFDEAYISTEEYNVFKNQIETCGRLLNGYIKYLLKQQNPKDEDTQL